MRLAALAMAGIFELPAQDLASLCDNELLTVSSWSIAEKGSGYLDAKVEYLNTSDRGIRTVRGYVHFVDILGTDVTAFDIAPDIDVAAGEVVETVTTLSGPHAQRLLVAHHDDIVASTCVSGVVYEDGTVERFD